MYAGMLNKAEAAKYLGMSMNYLRKSRCEGDLGSRAPGPAYHKVGRRILYSIEDLNDWLKSHNRRSRSPTPAPGKLGMLGGEHLTAWMVKHGLS